MKFCLTILVLVGTLAFTGCASLPKDVPGGGVVILGLKFDDWSSQSDPIHKVDLILSNGTTVRFEPKTGYLVLTGTDHDLTVTGVRLSLRKAGWSGSDAVSAVQIPLFFQPGKLHYLPFVFHYVQNDDPSIHGYFSSWTLDPLTSKALGRLKTLVATDPNAPYWPE